MTNDPAEVGRTRTINAASVSAPGGYLGENHGPAEFQRLWRSSLLAENCHFRSCCLGPSFPCCRFFRDQPLGCRVLGSHFDQLGRGIVFYEVFPLATRAFHCVAINLADNYLSPRLITPTFSFAINFSATRLFSRVRTNSAKVQIVIPRPNR